jgi:hypothetical protein
LLGIGFYLWNFWRFGLPSDEAMISDVRREEMPAAGTPQPASAT